MSLSAFYMTSLAASVTGLFSLWQVGIKPLLLDNFRDALFTQRDRLFALGNSGQLAYDSEAYRTMEVFLNSLIRYAFRFSFLSLLFSIFTFDEERAFAKGSSPSEVLLRRVQGVQNPNVRQELDSILQTVTLDLLPKYIAKSSVMFAAGTLLYFILAKFSPLAAKLKKLVVETFEAEAFRENDVTLSVAF